MSNINSGLNPQIFEEDKQITNFVIYNMIDGDKTYFYPIFDYFNPQVKFDKILPNDFFNLELKLGAFYNWNIFKDTNTRDDLMLELLVYYMKKGELLSLKIEIPLI